MGNRHKVLWHVNLSQVPESKASPSIISNPPYRLPPFKITSSGHAITASATSTSGYGKWAKPENADQVIRLRTTGTTGQEIKQRKEDRPHNNGVGVCG
jgi:hypothetical protein